MAIPKVQSIRDMRSVQEMLSLEGKVALVTGAAGGIGRSTAAAFAEIGAKVALMDIPQRADVLARNVSEIKSRFGGDVMYVTGDVSDEASVKSFVNDVVKAYGTIHIVHNNAGVGLAGDDSNIPIEQWNRIVAINQTGILLVGRTCANLMIEHRHGGSLITTSSMSGLIVNRLPEGSRYGVVYPATKAAVEHMTKAMAMDYCKFGIRFNSVCYGYIISGIHDVKAGFPEEAFDHMAESTPMGRVGMLDETVGCVVYLASDLSTFATGSTVVVDGGYTVW